MTTRRDALAWAITGMLAAAPRLAWAQAPNSEPRPLADGLAGLDAWLEAQRTGWRVPGLAVALVKDGRVVYQQGFGFRDAAQTLPVTTDTLFRGASTTKAFGAATVAMLVDEGKLAWDAPVSTHIPNLRLAGGEETRTVSLRDMLSHRTGLPPHDLLWYNNQSLSREGLAERTPFLEMSAPLRARYQYNNLMVALTGLAVERASGQTWEAFTSDRLFAPLGMQRANLSALDMARDSNHAVGHTTLGAARKPVAVPLRHDPLLGPAGGLNASIGEYAKWVQLQLGMGQFGGRRLISQASMAAMWEPLVLTSGTPRQPEVHRRYVGLGWRIDRYRDTMRVAHGGDLNGFTSRVVLLPQKNVGLAVLVNHGDHPLPNAVTPDLLDRLLGLAPEDNAVKALARRAAAYAAAPRPAPPAAAAGGRPSRELADYAGTYRHPGYGEMTVASSAEGLTVRYNDMPATLQHWQYDVFEIRTGRLEHGDFNGLKLSFRSDDAGAISGFASTLQEGVQPMFFRRVG
ncbi:MAG: serine hydrolase [Betaproteobacteria bacterium]